MKRIWILFLASALLLLSGCSRLAADAALTADRTLSAIEVYPSSFDVNTTWDDGEAVFISLADGASTSTGSGAMIEGDVITIKAGGDYVISGSLTDGQICVELDKTEKAHLILNGVSVSSAETAPLYVVAADKVCITTVGGTENIFSDESSTRPADDDLKHNLNACIYAADDISFNGAGTLTVKAYNNGIGCKNDVRICGGTVDINARQNGIKGRNSVYISAGTVNIKAGKDGLKSTNAAEPLKGFVAVVGGDVTIHAMDDGIQAITDVIVNNCSLTLRAADDKINSFGARHLDLNCIH